MMNSFGNQRGFSLIELSTSIGMSAIIVLAGCSLLAIATRYYNLSTNKLQTESEISRMTYLTKSYLSQAIDVRYGGTNCLSNLPNRPLLATSGAPNDGGVLYECSTKNPTFNSPDGSIFILGMFASESSRGGTAPTPRSPDLSFPVPTVFAFQKPTSRQLAGGISRAGAAYFYNIPNQNIVGTVGADFSSPPQDGSPAANAATITRVDRLVSMQILNVQTVHSTTRLVNSAAINDVDSPNAYVASADIEFTMRNFITGHPNFWVWCENGYSDSRCSSIEQATYRDYKRTVRVVFRNNRIYVGNYFDGNSSQRMVPQIALRRRLLGNMYFMAPLLPF